ncbi:MAG: InlB B-repeat-containing protein [Oscillospiraceae bacterium]|nr:InlB B-repeat-containing protein [Oscillospiraceae bacterium]
MFKRTLRCFLALSLVICVSLPSAAASQVSSSARVSFSAAGGRPIPAVSVQAGDTVERPADPERSGYRFTGWYTTSRKTTQYDFGAPVLGAMTLYAGWEKLPQVSFSTGGGKLSDGKLPRPITLSFGESFSSPPALYKAGYRFDGWYMDAKGETKCPEELTVGGSVRLYARWVRLPQISFNMGGGRTADGGLLPKQLVGYGDTAVKPDDPVRMGYIFTGWYTDSKKTKEYDFRLPASGSVTLYAKWSAVPTISFSAGGGKDAPAKKTVAIGEAPGKPDKEPAKAGYTFDGWYTSTKFTEQFDFSKPIEGSAKAYAKWIRNPVVSFSTKGKTPAPPKQQLLPGERASRPAVTPPPDYELEGWYSDSSCKKPFDFNQRVESAMTIYANWKRVNSPSVLESVRR